MAYVVSARKYRPQRFEDVVGQEHVTSTIINALLTDRLAHAFLFCGPRGVGKTTCARLLAKVINMPDPKTALQDGSYADMEIDVSLNIVELDAASNNSVEHIRVLIDQVRVQPQQGKYKVFIIDEVHMLSQAAFNAFLKTLEEPPPYAIFILATTERHKILPTILSRCQLYDFRRIQIPDIIKQLEIIATQENITAEHDALYVIAEKADGAMRDALSIFDRIASASNQNITLQGVVENLNILDFDAFFEATVKILLEDASGLLLLFDKVLKAGFEGDTFMNGWSGHLRNLLYCKENNTQELLQVSDSLKRRYLEQSTAISYGTLLTALNLANICDIQFPKAKDKRLHVEITLLKICFAQRQISADTLLSEPQKKTPEVSDLTPASQSVSWEPKTNENAIPQELEANEPVVNEPTPKKSSPKPAITKISSLDALIQEAEQEVAEASDTTIPLELGACQEIWDQYTDQMQSPTVKGILNNVKLSLTEDGALHAVVPTNISREEIQQETDLYSSLREHFNQNDLVILIEVDRAQFDQMVEDETGHLVTARDKYEHLKKINPLLDNLIDQLDLKIED